MVDLVDYTQEGRRNVFLRYVSVTDWTVLYFSYHTLQ